MTALLQIAPHAQRRRALRIAERRRRAISECRHRSLRAGCRPARPGPDRRSRPSSPPFIAPSLSMAVSRRSLRLSSCRYAVRWRLPSSCWLLVWPVSPRYAYPAACRGRPAGPVHRTGCAACRSGPELSLPRVGWRPGCPQLVDVVVPTLVLQRILGAIELPSRKDIRGKKSAAKKFSLVKYLPTHIGDITNPLSFARLSQGKGQYYPLLIRWIVELNIHPPHQHRSRLTRNRTNPAKQIFQHHSAKHALDSSSRIPNQQSARQRFLGRREGVELKR